MHGYDADQRAPNIERQVEASNYRHLIINPFLAINILEESVFFFFFAH